ncbi:asparaginase [Arcanobacterium bovis]|uniref:Asparaginase n=1 Tax=Arcanobacterium bovis TaxID=2529275 RepID=A0A4Q9UYT0_9ACTO|nr:asparaginase [Arcanobacterium bovis]TBW20817.1 asparaginase [Arcanobacterium bovis]
MRINVIYSGGTIGMIETEAGLAPGADLRGWLNDLVARRPSIGEVTFTEFSTLIDSSNATPADWQALIDALWSACESADGFVILHGTDTLAYASAALSFALQDFGKPVVLTGSQLPIGALDTDAHANVVDSLKAVASGRIDSVALVFGRSVFDGSCASKWSSWSFEGFSSPNAPVLATTGAPWQWNDVERRRHDSFPQVKPYVAQDIVVLDLVPGISAQRVDSVLHPRPSAVILRAYGTGNIPAREQALVDALASAVDDGVEVIVSSQCMQAQVYLGHYEAGYALAQLGAVSAHNMTFEACYAKTVFLLSQGMRGEKFKYWMEKSLSREITNTLRSR